MTVTAPALTCPGCEHEWDTHYPTGGCARPRCFCNEPRPVITAAERLAIIRAQVGNEPLLSHVDDKRTILIGHYITEKAADESDYRVRAGTVVERWHLEEGEPGVTAVDFIVRGRDTQVVIRRFMVDELRQEVLPAPDRYHCALVSRTLCRVVSQGIKRNGRADPLTDLERRYLNWAYVMDQTSRP